RRGHPVRMASPSDRRGAARASPGAGCGLAGSDPATTSSRNRCASGNAFAPRTTCRAVAAFLLRRVKPTRGWRRVSNVSLGREPVAAGATAGQDTNAPMLAIPEGWMIDDLARERLGRQLARAPDRICGVVAETGALPSGASYRVHAERLCLRSLSAATDTSRRVVQGAVLVRPGVAFEARDSVVEVEQGPLLVDPGAHVHDPWRPVGPIEPASTLGRPPFPLRPVVVFLACDPDVEALDWARAL